MIQVASLHVYPIKSCRSIDVARMDIDTRGPVHDRRLMIVDEDGKFITQRTDARLSQITVRRKHDHLTLEGPGIESLTTTIENGPLRPVEVWRHRGEAHHVHPEADRWLSQFLQRDVALVGCPEDMQRVADPDWARQTTPISFVDGYPILILSEASVEDLNTRLQTPVDAMRFRPNIRLRGCVPFAEDGWKTIRIGDAVIDILKPCDRCSVVSIDPVNGATSKEPLSTLATFRKSPAGILFGQNGATREPATLRTGDSVEVLETRLAEDVPAEFRLE